ncbi:hypothetical protein KIMH_12370 [Bombiscardovia apis]|uniref:Uncharacterized protein n=1 Tax=Bombiscardovia apis TaxID=2932182 RepID=A0ABN6SKP1_9BIFI|nr:hypothetical protein KIMH_12370 [Bombiscardovia apis]
MTRSALAWHVAYQQSLATPQAAIAVTSPADMTIKAQQTLGQAAKLLAPAQLELATRAEDKAGFSTTLLAARSDSDGSALLKIGDRHHAAAQQLASAIPGSDPRKAVYSAQPLLDHPVTMRDPANGVEAPTAAVVEANCSRFLLEAFQGFARNTTKSHKSASQQGKDGSTSKSAPAQTVRQEQLSALTTFSALATAHLYTALEQGYPANDDLLLAPAGSSQE